MRLSLRQLQIFVAVAEHGGTATAAQAIALSQSATSAALKELERLLEATLFDRVGKRLVLNDNGRLLLPQARQMLDAAATIERQFVSAEGLTGNGLRIGASTTIGIYLLPNLLAAAASPATPTVHIANTADIAAAVADFSVDVGLIEGPCHQPELNVQPWLRDELIIVCAPQHPLAQGQADVMGRIPVALADLQQARWLLREPGSGTREAVEQTLLPFLHHLQPAAQFSHAEAIKQAAAAGLGVTCLSRSVVADFLENQRLVVLKAPLPPMQRDFFLVTHRDKVLSLRLQAFLKLCWEWATTLSFRA